MTSRYLTGRCRIIVKDCKLVFAIIGMAITFLLSSLFSFFYSKCYLDKKFYEQRGE